MCGIFALLNNECYNEFNDKYNSTDIALIRSQFMKGMQRGPEFSKLETSYNKMVLGFHRLAINGLNETSNQPLVIDDVVLICNGEIYNYKDLYTSMGVEPVTGSDCEVIIHLYIRYGMEQTLIMLDGVFAFVLFDNRIIDNLDNRVYIARDPYGVRPLYTLKNIETECYSSLYGFASELKCLEHFYNNNNNNNNNNTYRLEQFTPGTYSVFELSSKVLSCWKPMQENIPYFYPTFPHNIPVNRSNTSLLVFDTCINITNYMLNAVEKRCITTERPIACLLSGGLDSSLVAALVMDYYNKFNVTSSENTTKPIETYSIGLKGSEDLKYAQIVADYIGSQHTEIIVTEQEMFDIIPEVIENIESYDTTTVRASLGNYLLGKYISLNSDAKVIFNGDGSDELFGGYLYMNECPDDIEYDRETRRLLKDIHLFDVLRSDKSISSNGLEPRTPFLDKSFTSYVLSLPPFLRNHKNHSAIEKFLLRTAFSKSYYQDCNGRQILPDNILWRKKEAFSDGVSSQGRSLFVILQEKIAEHLNLQNVNTFQPCLETEKYYYKTIFDTAYPNCQDILPYFWMPKYTNATDPSARTLSIYQNTENVKI